MFNLLHYFTQSTFVKAAFALSLLVISVFYWSCQKEPVVKKTQSFVDRSISIDAVKEKYFSEGVSERSSNPLPLDVEPDWTGIRYFQGGQYPVVLVKVTASSLLQNDKMGGHLYFFKNPVGEIESALICWNSSDTTTYTEEWAPLDTFSNFTGHVLVINDRDTLTKFSQIKRGHLKYVKSGAIAVSSLMNGSFGLQSRGPGTNCPNNFGTTWWERFWCNFLNALSSFGSIFSITGDANGTSYYYLGFQSFVFVDEGWSGNDPYGYPHNGGSVGYTQQFSNQMSVCQEISDFYNSFGTMPTNYSQSDLQFCELSAALGLNGAQNECLYRVYGTPALQEVYEYWQTHEQNSQTADAIKAYLDSRCAGTSPALVAEFLDQQFCLSGHPIDVLQQIQQECGLSLNDPGQWEQNMNGVLSECVKDIIVQDRIDLIAREYGIQLLPGDITNLACDAISSIAEGEILSLSDGLNDFTYNPADQNVPAISATRNMCPAMFNFTYTDNTQLRQSAGITNLVFRVPINGVNTDITISRLYFSSENLNGCPESLAQKASDAINAAIISTTTRINEGRLYIRTVGELIEKSIFYTFLVEVRKKFHQEVQQCAPHHSIIPVDVRALSDWTYTEIIISEGTVFTDFSQFISSCD